MITDNEAQCQLKVKQLSLSQLENEALITNNYLALRILEIYDEDTEEGCYLTMGYDDLNNELIELKIRVSKLESELETLDAGEDI